MRTALKRLAVAPKLKQIYKAANSSSFSLTEPIIPVYDISTLNAFQCHQLHSLTRETSSDSELSSGHQNSRSAGPSQSFSKPRQQQRRFFGPARGRGKSAGIWQNIQSPRLAAGLYVRSNAQVATEIDNAEGTNLKETRSDQPVVQPSPASQLQVCLSLGKGPKLTIYFEALKHSMILIIKAS